MTSLLFLLTTFLTPSFISTLCSIVSPDLKSWLKLRKMLPRKESFPWQHPAVLQFCVALQDVRTFSFTTLSTWTCSSSFKRRYEASRSVSSLWEGWQNQPALNHCSQRTVYIPNNSIIQAGTHVHNKIACDSWRVSVWEVWRGAEAASTVAVKDNVSIQLLLSQIGNNDVLPSSSSPKKQINE